jgi:hypothetical protein
MQEALELSVGEMLSSQTPSPRQFTPRTFSFHLSPEVSCEVIIAAKQGGFTVQDIKRLIAMLELQRSFLCDEPLDVTVNVSTPRAQDVVRPAETPVNIANLHEVLASKSTP